MKRSNVVPDLRRLAETSPIREVLYAMASPDGPDDVRPKLHDDEWWLMKESGGIPWWSGDWHGSVLRSQGFSHDGN